MVSLMTVRVTIQHASKLKDVPASQQLRRWVKAALNEHQGDAELTIRIVDEKEGQELNRKWRNKNKPTNVLSFPLGESMGNGQNLLGDIIICAPVVKREANEQHKPLESHWAHMVIHGTLHLLGYDHIKNNEAKIMENLETKMLAELGYPNPYH